MNVSTNEYRISKDKNEKWCERKHGTRVYEMQNNCTVMVKSAKNCYYMN